MGMVHVHSVQNSVMYDMYLKLKEIKSEPRIKLKVHNMKMLHMYL